MARETYREVTAETVKALKNFVSEIAYEWRKSETYLYAILSGLTSDPFLKFESMFKAVAKKNPPGARGYIVRLNRVYAQENPTDRLTADLNETDLEYDNVKAMLRAREEGKCSQAELEAAKYRFIEKFARLGQPERVGEMQPS